ncbi:MAG: hypothetical protein FGM34_06805 [Solirubrobacteraceae bacterium]|nr:hypothetical protein [Solirubrobacteraceae bacterium]
MRDYLERMHDWLEGQHESHRGRHPAFRAFMVALGSILIPVGIVLIPLPGPGIGMIAVGLGILSLEFHWPRRILRWLMNSRLLGAQARAPAALPAKGGAEAPAGRGPADGEPEGGPFRAGSGSAAD